MWQRLRKSELVEEAIEKASRSASGLENDLRVEFRAILNNKKKRAGLTKAEITAMEAVVKGTKLGNRMKQLARFGLGRGQQSNVLSGAVGTMAFGPGSILAGELAGRLSESITGRNAANVASLVRAGGSPNPATVARLAPRLPGLLDYGTQVLAPRVSEPLFE